MAFEDESHGGSMGEPLIEISDPDSDRYARLRLMDEDEYRQDVIRQAKIMVVGAGALGNEVLKNLALLGAGHLFVVDFDAIEVSNLTRSVFFRADDRGRAKVDVMAERVQALNPDVSVIPVRGDITCDVGLGVFRAMDIVIGCLDNRAARLAVNRACWRVGRPWVDGALHVADGSVRVFVPPEGACYECLMNRRDYELLNMRYACPPASIMEGVQITTPMSASIIGAMQVQEAVKLLHRRPVAGGQGTVYSAETLRTTAISYPRRADCPAHEQYDPVIALPDASHAMTTGQFVAMIRPYVGEKAVVFLPDPVVTVLFCPVCDTAESVYRPHRQLTPGDLRCAACGTTRVYDVTGTVSGGTATRDIPLAQMGIPPLDILSVRGQDGRQVYAELSSDRVLAGW